MENVLIAEGDHAIQGEDGRLEYLFNVEQKNKTSRGRSW